MPDLHRDDTAVKQQIELELAGFAGAALEVEAERHSLTREELVALAAEYYLSDDGPARPARRVPAWLDELDAGDKVPLAVELRLETWQALAEHARVQRTTVERVLEHATLSLIADLDSGRITARVESE